MHPYIGTAGWSVPAAQRAAFGSAGTHLERYAVRLNAVEINSSFYRPHQRKTYTRWAASVPENFRFAVKIPKLITHERRLIAIEEPLTRFLEEAGGLGAKLGVLLVQLPPSLTFEPEVAEAFFEHLKTCTSAPVAFEPRHPSWFCESADALLEARQVARVAADPARAPGAGEPGGWCGLVYYRLHGAPRIYYSSYATEWLKSLRCRMERTREAAASMWCIFDNTALGAALDNALEMAAAFGVNAPSVLR